MTTAIEAAILLHDLRKRGHERLATAAARLWIALPSRRDTAVRGAAMTCALIATDSDATIASGDTRS